MYPYLLQNNTESSFPLLGKENFKTEPFFLDLSRENTKIEKSLLQNQKEFQVFIEQKMYSNYDWGISGYLEYREPLLSHLPQMNAEKRFFHLGIDIFVPAETKLYAPLSGSVELSGFEEGEGNFGGFVLLRHVLGNETFFSLYGHLSPKDLPSPKSIIQKGESFARIGDFDQNGNWFSHTHLQILTERGFHEGYLSKGYCTEKMLPHISALCPDPLPLFRYES